MAIAMTKEEAGPALVQHLIELLKRIRYLQLEQSQSAFDFRFKWGYVLEFRQLIFLFRPYNTFVAVVCLFCLWLTQMNDFLLFVVSQR